MRFSAIQESIITNAYYWQTEKCERYLMERVTEISGQRLYGVLRILNQAHIDTRQKLEALPQRNKLSGYLIHGMAAAPYKSALFTRVDGGPDYIELPGNDIEQSINVAYDSLEGLLDSLLRIMEICKARIREYEEARRDPFFGNENRTPHKQILDLPEPIDYSQKKSFVDALVQKKGTIVLRQFNKTNASKILRNIDDCMRALSSGLTDQEKASITVVCKDLTFRWYSEGSEGGKVQDQARKSSTTQFVKVNDHIEAWIQRNPSGL